MKIVVIGGSGLIGSKVVQRLGARGHDAVPASPASGVNTLTGQGLDEALTGADVVVDVANSPSFEDDAVLDFFRTAGHNLAAAEKSAGVGHHVALSIVGVDRMQSSGYMRAKLAQEEIVRGSGVPYTIVRATQFFEFLGTIADGSTVDGAVRLPDAPFRPVAAEDVADAVTDAALAAPTNGEADLAGPDVLGLDEFVRRALAARGDARRVVTDPGATYFGAGVGDGSLVPAGASRVGRVSFEEWIR